MKNVHIFAPPYVDNVGFIPAAFLWLKTYYEHRGKNVDHYNWITPLVKWTTDDLWQQIEDNPPDVWAFGGYIWNIKLCYSLAKRIKQHFPNCLIVAGGPQPEYKHDKEYFKKHPYIDLVVPADGEIPFTEILDAYINNTSFNEVSDIIIPTDDGWTKSNNTFNVKDFTWPASVISSQLDVIKEWIRIFDERTIVFLYESSRGCPYKCVFCDWGGGTHTKTRQKPFEMICNDMKLLSDLKVDRIHFSDANFGLFERDIDIAKYVCEVSKSGHPKDVTWFQAKNNKRRAAELTVLFANAGLSHHYLIDLQDFNKDILDNIDRIERPWGEQIECLKYVMANSNITDISVNTMSGLPGQTFDTISNDVDRFMINNLNYSRYSPWIMLPNSPGAEPEYIDRMKIKTKPSIMLGFPVAMKKNTGPDREAELPRDYGDAMTGDLDRDIHSSTDIIVETFSFTQEQWIDIRIFTAIVYACSTLGITKYLTHGLYHLYDIKYSSFYKKLYTEFFPNSTGQIKKLFDEMKNQLTNNLKNDIFTIEIENDQFGEDFPFLLPPDVYSSISILWNSDEFYNQLNEYLNLNDIQQDLFNFNRNMMITPDYDPSTGRSWSNHYDWLSWFNTHFTGVVTDKISQFPKKIDISYMATDTHTTYSVYAPLEILWHKQNNELEHLMDYFYKCCYGSKTDKLFKNITILKE